eukprot:TRINITY_DN3171_c0_g1_i1.p1 TRINITY_DN3171_c0_g1~~TRINITY_DN3171_c0_g1_i1.p1  ORF type:complete len:1000 (-),score=246.87 TRINITY_DN3171_c0_g1_i1:589-3549(-)
MKLLPDAAPEPSDQDKLWEHHMISDVLQLLLAPSNDPALASRTVLPDMGQSSSSFSIGDLDQALVERISLAFPPDRSPLSYLVRAAQNSFDYNTRIKNSADLSQSARAYRTYSLDTLRNRLASYAGLIMAPDTEMINPPARKKCLKDLRIILSTDPLHGRAFPPGFFKTMVSSMNDVSPTALNELFQQIVDGVVKAKTIQDLTLENYQAAFRTLVWLAQDPFTSKILVAHDEWIPANAYVGRDIEYRSIMGRYFQLMVSPNGPEFDQGHTKLTLQHVDFVTQEIRGKLNALYDILYEACFGLVRADTVAKDRLLDWICKVLVLNAARSKMQYNPALVSTDRFLLNLNKVMIMLCLPFMKAATAKARLKAFSLVNPLYTLGFPRFLKTTRALPRINFLEETRIGTAHDELESLLKQFYEEETTADKTVFSFATDIFFSTMQALHIGLIRTFQNYDYGMRSLRHQQQLLRRMSNSNNPRDSEALEQENARVNKMVQSHLILKSQLLNHCLLQDAAQFYQWSAVYLVHLLETNVEHLKLLPEFMVVDILEFFISVNRFTSEEDFLRTLSLDDLLTFVIEFISPTSPLKNPHIRSKMPEILVMFLPQKGTIIGRHHVFETHPRLREHLVHSLVDLYVDVEHTGRSNAFYEKFSSRHLINELFEFLWSLPFQREKFIELSSSESFTGFINMMLNDAVWMLDRSIEMLTQIKNDEKEMDNVQEWRSQPFDVQRQREETYAETGDSLSGHMRLANEQIHCVYYLSSEPRIASVFVSDTFVERMAQMLDYYLFMLLGPKVANLSVKEPEKYSFTPRVLLREIVGTFLNLCRVSERREEFLRNVVQDERSYKPEVFRRALRFFRKKALIPSNDIIELDQVVVDLEKLAGSVQDLESMLGEIPEKYLDPLMQSLMRDPVLLPSSKVPMERSVITRHLLNTPTDPFNRQPLKVEELLPAPELKKEIEDWIASKIAQARAKDTVIDAKIGQEDDDPTF